VIKGELVDVFYIDLAPSTSRVVKVLIGASVRQQVCQRLAPSYGRPAKFQLGQR
jgi:hypothetical protein